MSASSPTSFVGHLDDETARALAARGSARALREGEVLFLQAERASRMAVVESGLLKVTATRLEAGYCVLGLRGPGELVGEMAAIDGRLRTATVTAAAPTVVRQYGLREFRELVDRYPDVGLAVVRSLASRMRESDELRLIRASGSVPRRLAHCLVRLATDYGRIENGGIVIEMSLSQEDFAGLVDSSRDAVAKALHEWRAQGLVTTGRRRVVLVDPARFSSVNGL